MLTDAPSLLAFSKKVRDAETLLANLRATALTFDASSDKRRADKLKEIRQKIGDAGYELLLVQEIIHQLISTGE